MRKNNRGDAVGHEPMTKKVWQEERRGRKREKVGTVEGEFGGSEVSDVRAAGTDCDGGQKHTASSSLGYNTLRVRSLDAPLYPNRG